MNMADDVCMVHDALLQLTLQNNTSNQITDWENLLYNNYTKQFFNDMYTRTQ